MGGWNKGKKTPYTIREKQKASQKEVWKNGKRKLTKKCDKCGSFKGKDHNCYKIAKKLSIANSGKNHWNWQGGITKRTYPKIFFNRLRDLIKSRDNFTCQICGLKTKEKGNKLVTHHIDWNKKNISLDNLTTVCRSCHAFIHNGKKKRNIGRIKWW